ncbi:MAG: dTDP-4-dehydrorhamnose 3,5-epimerase [Planctomycetaceae bacterium]|nr:dTDP-4-dehydrorhamnose 3,5-epimerase [Planctomycetaceae bacterium]|tara:strand:+ start:4848 stop:5420 length:573 start_codon:yes stop_codon:yes gene_type:complete
MNVLETPLVGVLVIEPRVFEDQRGFFLETYQQTRFSEAGIDIAFVQDNWSHSTRGTLRGLHYQLSRPQAKLVQVVTGSVFDVAVDLRRESPSFGQWYGTTLSQENHRQLLIPRGCAHGFLVTSDSADFQYKCSDIYHPESERTLLWNDPDIGIEWPLQCDPILSAKDRAGLPLARAECFETTGPGVPGDA